MEAGNDSNSPWRQQGRRRKKTKSAGRNNREMPEEEDEYEQEMEAGASRKGISPRRSQKSSRTVSF